jgi:hypothetical protein
MRSCPKANSFYFNAKGAKEQRRKELKQLVILKVEIIKMF